MRACACWRTTTLRVVPPACTTLLSTFFLSTLKILATRPRWGKIRFARKRRVAGGNPRVRSRLMARLGPSHRCGGASSSAPEPRLRVRPSDARGRRREEVVCKASKGQRPREGRAPREGSVRAGAGATGAFPGAFVQGGGSVAPGVTPPQSNLPGGGGTRNFFSGL